MLLDSDTDADTDSDTERGFKGKKAPRDWFRALAHQGGRPREAAGGARATAGTLDELTDHTAEAPI